MKAFGILTLRTEGRQEQRDNSDETGVKRVTREWLVKGPIPVLYLNRLVPDSFSYRSDQCVLSDTVNTVELIDWLMLRYPLEIDPACVDYWQERVKEATENRLRREAVSELKPVEAGGQFIGTLREFQKIGLDFFLKTSGRTLLADEMGLGKAQPLDAKLLTPEGWKSMGEIKIGDRVIGKDGEAHHVIGTFPQGMKDVYRVTFSDGSATECTDDHLWQVLSTNHRFRGTGGHILKLTDIRRKTHYANGNRLHYIPMVAPVNFRREKPLSVDPYLMGVLLGDGDFARHSVRLTTADPEILDWVGNYLTPFGLSLKEDRKYHYRLSRAVSSSAPNWLVKELKRYGLMGSVAKTKRVPEDYKLASVNDRISLLQGLLDTDGYVSRDGHVLQHTTISPELAADVKFLVNSLGGVVRVATKIPSYTYKLMKLKGQTAYTLTLSLPPQIMPLRLTRKLSRYRVRSKYLPTRAIESIALVGRKECQCIAVDNMDGLYVTDDFIVTHNTVMSLAYLATIDDAFPCCVVAPLVVLKHWGREVEKFLRMNGRLVNVQTIRDGKAGRLPSIYPITIINYDLLRKRVDDLLPLHFKTVIFDEIQSLKNTSTWRYRAALELIGGKSVRHVIGLSGTPIHNHVGELWAVSNLIRPGLLGTYHEFLAQHCDPNAWKPTARNPSGLYELLRQEFLLRRRKIEVLKELPPKLRVKEHIDADLDAYEREVAKILEALDAKLLDAKTTFERSAFQEQAIKLERQVAALCKVEYVVRWVQACLPPDTIIPGRKFSPISQLSVRQEVFGYDGNPDSIKKVMSRNYAGELIEISLAGTLPLVLTPEHPVLTVRRVKVGLKARPNTYPIFSFLPPVWKKPGELTPVKSKKDGDYLILPRLTCVDNSVMLDLTPFTIESRGNGHLQASGPRKLPLDKNLAWIIGLYVAEGSAHCSVEFSLGHHEVSLVKVLRSKCRYVGYSSRVRVLPSVKRVTVDSVLLARFLRQHCGHRATEKRVPEFILNHSKLEILQAFLDGYLEGDGCLTGRHGTKSIQSAATVSRVLALQLQLLTSRLGNPFSIWLRRTPKKHLIAGREVHCHTVYDLKRFVNLKTERTRMIVMKDKVLFPVKGIRKKDYSGEVYNLETSSHTYLANNVVVHNCLESEEPIIVYFHHRVILEALQRYLSSWNPCVIVGGQNDTKRDDEIQRFQNGQSQLMLASIRAGSLGINLTASSIVIFAELDWVPAWHRQAEDRAHRIGQENQVLIYYLIADGTLDETVAEVLVDKTEKISALLGDPPEGENSEEAVRAIEALRSLPAFQKVPLLAQAKLG